MATRKRGSVKDTDTLLITSVDLATSDVTGVLPVANGGTGQGSYTDGQLLIGNTSGNTLAKATLTAGAGINVTNGGGSITLTTGNKGSDIASATTTDIGAATGDFVDVTGTTTITGLGTIAAGIERTVRFTGALTLTHNATSLILPGAANITTAANDRAVFRSLGSGNWLCVDYIKASGTAVVSGGGLTNWSESAGTYSSKDWKRFYPVSGTNVNAVFSPLGTGSIQAHVADGTSAGGNQRGNNAVDWQTFRNAGAKVASGAYSVLCGGINNTVSGNGAFIGGGYSNTASGNYAGVLCGNNTTASAYGAIAAGVGNVADGQRSLVIGGMRGTARGIYGVSAFASGRFATTGDAQERRFVLRKSSTSATPVVLTSDAGSASTTNQIILPNNSCFMIRGLSACLRTDSAGDRATYEWTASVYRGANAGTTTLDASSVSVIYEGDATFDFTLAADTTNGGLTISFVGASGKTVRAVTTAWCCEVTS